MTAEISESEKNKLREAAARHHYSGDWPSDEDVKLLLKHDLIEPGKNKFSYIQKPALYDMLGIA